MEALKLFDELDAFSEISIKRKSTTTKPLFQIKGENCLKRIEMELRCIYKRISQSLSGLEQFENRVSRSLPQQHKTFNFVFKFCVQINKNSKCSD